MAKRLLDAGFPEADVVVVENAPRKGNLVARLRGRDTGRRPIMLLAHIDVVEANPEDWTLPPFEFIERDGTFYGRGVADDKDEAAIHVANLIRLKQEGFVPDRDIIVALTADEEGGPDNGVEWILENRPELFDAEFALNEGGGGELKDGVRLSNTVQASEKKVQNFLLEVTNPGGHSSRPVRDNAITHLADALVKIGAFDFPVRLNEVTREFFSRSAALAGPEEGAAMRALVANAGDAEAAALLARDPAHNSRMRTTCVATMLEGGHARNALPQRARANVNCRILPDESAADVQRTLERVAANPHVTFAPVAAAEDSPPSPLGGQVLAAVEKITKEMWPGVPVIPVMSTGATDGLYLRNKGIPVYGVSGLFYGDTFAHGMNERVPAEGFYQGLEFLLRLTRELTTRPVS
jgi:acetylornithine deacetylase/succinyl-diaminopimelate desuccinylase-like protein